jgi:hypothetical protein
MIDFDHIRAVKRDAQVRLLKIPGVHAVAIGPKVVAGRSTADPSIIIYLVKKKSPAEIPPEELIPAEIDGIKTDVIEQSLPTVGGTLEGGLKISGPNAHGGTLGCIVTSSDKSKVYAITCYHVVMPRHHQEHMLKVSATTAGNSVTYVFSGSVEPQTLIYVNFQPVDLMHGLPEYGAFYTTTGTETLDEIAANVAQAVEDMSVTGIDTSLPGGGLLDIDFLDGYKSECTITGKTTSPPSDLHAKIDGTTITFSGKVSGEFYGVFTNVNPGGVEPTYGAFAPLNKGDDMEEVANAVAGAVDSVHITGIDVSSVGATVTIETPMEIDVVISPDTRMGQPQLCSICSRCCGPSIGSVDEARFDVDTALIELDPGITYFADQLNFGPVKDYYFVQDNDIHPGPYPVKKYGARTGKTHGNVTALDRVGYRGADGSFSRQYSGVMTVAFDVDNEDNSPDAESFSDHGDSGSAVLNSDDEIVGTVFAHTNDGSGLVTPIQSIINAFDITIATAQTAGQTQTVLPFARSRVSESRAPIAGGMPVSKNLLHVQEEILVIPAGKEYADAITQHAGEVQRLINTNRRVAAVWQRSGGPQIIQAALNMMENRSQVIPAEIEGKPLADCIAKIQKALLRYSSPGLAAGLRKYAPRLGELAGLNYMQSLAWLKAPRTHLAMGASRNS